MTGAGRGDREAPAKRTAALGREVVERVLLNLWSLPSRVDRAPITKGLEEAMRALDALQASELEDPAHLDRLRDGIARVEEARRRFEEADAGAAGERPIKSLGDLGNALSESLHLTMDRLVAMQGLLLRRPPVKEAPAVEVLPFRASVGLPVLHTLDRKPLPLGIRVEALPGPDDEEDEASEVDEEDEVGEASGPGEAGGPGDNDRYDDVNNRNEGSLERLEPSALGAPTSELNKNKQNKHEEQPRAAMLSGGEDSSAVASALDPSLSPALNQAMKAELEGLRRIARDCMEELGSLGLLRAPDGPSVAWATGPAGFEQRLLSSLDALIALGHPYPSIAGDGRFDVLAALLDYAGDAFVPDPSRAFARAFVLGCVAGEDTVRAAVIALRQSHRMTYLAQRDALALAPNPAIGPAMRKLCGSGSSALARVALDVLRLRWEATFEAAAPFVAHPEASVRIAAARCLAAAQAREPATRLLERRLEMEDDDRVLAVVAESLLRLDALTGLTAARDKLTLELASPGSLSTAARIDFARLLGVAGGATDVEILLRLLDKSPQEASAAGLHGHPALIPALVAALKESEGVAARAGYVVAAARALHRITGLGLLEMEPKPAIEAADPPAESSFWQARIEAAQKRFEPIQRFRFGRPFTPFSTLSEAEAEEVPADRRVDCELELAILSGGASRFHARDWVVRQKAELKALRERFAAVERGGYEPGVWPAARIGRLAGVL